MGLYPAALPDFPWDSLAPFRARAAEHPDGIVDLSVGTPVDSTPDVIKQALISAADAPGYPTTHGTPQLRQAIVDWFARRRGVPGLDPQAAFPTVGSKELVALLPALLGIGPHDAVVHPTIAYPTYDVGTKLVGAEAIPATSIADWQGNTKVRLVWVNSPSNPTGRVMTVSELAEIVQAAREIGAVVASDECYAELLWDSPGETAPSLLDPRVTGGDLSGLLVTYSLSKQSNLAGYRAAFVAGDPQLVADLVEVRKHAGMIVPTPVQQAMTVALSDDDHVAHQRALYQARREVLISAFIAAGFTVESEAGLYLWVTKDEDCWTTLEALADHGIIAAPGDFYGPQARSHVRIALTASDEQIQKAALRIVTRR